MHPTYVEINLNAIRQNISNICQKVHPAKVMAVIKADGYGHGAVPVARVALQAGATRLAVAFPGEGTVLREAGIEAPIHLMGGFFPEQMQEIHSSRLEFTLCDFHTIDDLETFAQSSHTDLPVHVKFDTGMRRVGFWWEDAENVFKRLNKSRSFNLVGLMTHFATADENDKTFAYEQLRRFHHVIEQAKWAGLRFRYIHAANSGAILDMPETYFDLVRAGISMYGYYPSGATTESIPIQPAMAWRSRLVQVKKIAADEPVSYGAAWIAPHETIIGTVPVGYADGYNRKLTNRIHAVVNGRRVPVVGRVCMDMIILDLGPNAQDKAGDEVVLLGSDGKAEVLMDEFCKALGTIPYEVTCAVSKRVPRVYRDV
ncbi:MAG: alanine racemase [bacterium]